MVKKSIKAAALPDSPGVYIFQDANGDIIYVGKAASLRKRVGSYFSGREAENPRLAQLRERIAEVDFIVTSGEVEALILEANLIKRHHPDYNIEFRDDKSYPYMVICTEDTYPRVMFARGKRRKGVVYYGPFAHAGAVRETIDTLRKVFPFRACRGREPGKSTGSPCLDYHIKICSGPCIGAVSPEEYADIIAGVREFMEGRHDVILAELEQRMRGEAGRQEYELAARTRDRIIALGRLLERQQAHTIKEGDQDVFAVYAGDLDACVTVFYIRGGKILGKQDLFTTLPQGRSNEEVMAAFLPQFYSQATYFPREVILSHDPGDDERDLLEHLLRAKAGRKVRVIVPQRGKKRSLVGKVGENARLSLEVHLAKQASDLGWISRATNGVYEALGLKNLPYRIECYDISNLGSEDAVGSMVVYEAGVPARKDYRRFRIRGVQGQNDAAMMEEVLERRLEKLTRTASRANEETGGVKGARLDSFHKKPDLILIDGGQAQLAAALKALQRRDFWDIDVAALAKRMEEVYLPGAKGTVSLPRDSEALHLLQRIRDEAHRYALDYHRQQRSLRTRRSALDDIPGVGPKRKKSLLGHYGSISRLAEAPLEELEALGFLDRRTARNVYRRFHGMDGESHDE
ncbi:MAG: excinuclease ABC subunit UvrC [Actinobacteria bacterium]|nr:excinuclease ABC subunit UvrC [Actinomycetota bacterium]